jgi:hypothetical protein
MPWKDALALLGPLYLLMADTEGALRSFIWFEQTFPDDSDDPLHVLCWTLALYRSGERNKAAAKLCQIMLSNPTLMLKPTFRMVMRWTGRTAPQALLFSTGR